MHPCLYSAVRMRTFARILLACVAAAIVGAGGPGLRALHLATDAGHCSAHALAGDADRAGAHRDCAHHHHDEADEGHDGDHGDEAPDAPPHDDLGCATCELLLALATVIPDTTEVPAFLALVAVTDAAAPPARPAPPAPRALAARPPPSC